MNDYTDEEYFGEMKLMFQSKGWDMLRQELIDNSSVINNVQSTKDSDDLSFRKGQLAVLGYLINLEEHIQRAESEAALDTQAV